MHRRFLLPAILLALLAAVSWPQAAKERPDAQAPALTEAGLEADDFLMMLDEDGPEPPDMRVLVAAPRVAVIGKASSVLLVMRPGRVLNVEAGERVRFLSGVREAVWYRGAGAIRSGLSLHGGPAGDPAAPLGEDLIELRGAAPEIHHGLARVDLVFQGLGAHEVQAAVRAGVKPAKGKARGQSREALYHVRVHAPGTLGSIAGHVERSEDGMPVPGYPVVAIDAATDQAVGGAVTRPDGSYEIRRLPPGSYLVAVPFRRGFVGEFFDDAPDAPGATPVAVDPGAASGGVDFLLDRP